MGKISQGILGGFSGKVGNVIGGNWKGINYMRVKPASVANPQTDGQMDQRSRFNTALKFLQPMKDFIKIGFKNYAVKMTEFNSAMSLILKNSITGIYPDYVIDYATALVSKGTLLSAIGSLVESTVANSVSFTWTDNSNGLDAQATDVAMVVVYNPAKVQASYLIAGTRADGNLTLLVPETFSGDEVQCYLAFKGATGSKVSDSVYVGAVTIA
jgi:hypothetical protein